MIDPTRSLDELYFEWLIDYIGYGRHSVDHPERTYQSLMMQMFQTAFDDSVPNDYNRSLDGKDLRNEFLASTKLTPTKEWLDLDCSIFEMLVGLARRMEFNTDLPPNQSFGIFMSNLELVSCNDSKYSRGVAESVQHILDRLNDRSYDYNGRGGLFPLSDPRSDQRGVEIWYQMSAYLLENFEF